jgi:hypothetical protein
MRRRTSGRAPSTACVRQRGESLPLPVEALWIDDRSEIAGENHLLMCLVAKLENTPRRPGVAHAPGPWQNNCCARRSCRHDGTQRRRYMIEVRGAQETMAGKYAGGGHDDRSRVTASEPWNGKGIRGARKAVSGRCRGSLTKGARGTTGIAPTHRRPTSSSSVEQSSGERQHNERISNDGARQSRSQCRLRPAVGNNSRSSAPTRSSARTRNPAPGFISKLRCARRCATASGRSGQSHLLDI